MTRRRNAAEPEAPQTKLSRGDIETLIVLHVVGADGCPLAELAGRLGLSDSIAGEIATGMESLVTSGLLVVEEGSFHLTDTGRDRLERRAGTGILDLFALL